MSISNSVRKNLRGSGFKNAHRRARLMLEVLEMRSLMSVTVVNAKTATFTDVDGDLVTVTVSKGALTGGLFTTAASGLGEQLQTLDLTAAGFTGANVTISVKQTGTGDGLTNVGYINAGGHALGKVVVAGDLGRIDVGSSAKAGVTGLTVFSMGRQGTNSQLTGGSLVSFITTLGALTVTTDLQEAFINVAANIGNIYVGGSLIGGAAANSGSIQSASGSIGNVFVGQSLTASSDAGATGNASIQAKSTVSGNIGNVTVFGSLTGGAGADSAEIFAGKNMGQVTVGGDLRGGDGHHSAEIEAFFIAGVNVNGSLLGGTQTGSGSILASKIGNVTISGSVVGGDGEESGSVVAGADLGAVFKIGNVTVGGSVIGGAGIDSGAIWSFDSMGKVVILHDLIGGDGSPGANALYTGYIEADGKLASVVIGGSIIAGTNSGTAGKLLSGYIHAGSTVSSVTVNGSLVGSSSVNVQISAGTSLGTVFVGGRVDHAQILGGFGFKNSDTVMPEAAAGQIGKITVSGDWIASSALAGVTAGNDNLPGTGDDTVISGSGAGKGKIGSIAIAGQVFGTGGAGDNFGFVSSSIGSFSATGVKALLTTGKDTIVLGPNTDVVIKEV